MHRQSTRISRVCQHCLAPFEALPSEVRRGKALFCSRACRSAARTRDLAERFWAKVNKRSGKFWCGSECWEWHGATAGYGHGHIRSPGKRGHLIYAHRLAWELVHGPIPVDEEAPVCVLHHCDNPPCVNPAHLFLGTQLDNIHDRDKKGRGKIAITKAA